MKNPSSDIVNKFNSRKKRMQRLERKLTRQQEGGSNWGKTKSDITSLQKKLDGMLIDYPLLNE